MRRKRSFKSHRPQQNLDSFLDILTNTVGVLMFISLFITLVAAQSSTIVRTPLVSQSDKKVNFFEIRGNRVIYLDNKSATQQLKDFVGNLPTCVEPSYSSSFLDSYAYIDELRNYQNCLTNKIQQLKDFRAETKNYEIELVDLESMSWKYNPKSNTGGELAIDLVKPDSEYQKTLAQLDLQQDYLAFLVRPDSFAAFRQARQIAWKAGFDVGWEPQTSDGEIIFGSGGRKIGVQ
ncbi:hypothetical protein H6G41_33270 [Tolypothrix sp. FACHB-123]|uniref:hypothetical protein n=1 Tax=Tolypothrix sp. FACHB-123 TaxID=2692868 RepID=UPI00168338A9|nr:hypothetical protein [Tolypothrix sp. FACHB-123]MBD2359395.1 hypothetical protein [Tolypothrix sp. FACHB-123]